jgi:uncharacterized protein (TIGR04255 family)
VDASKEEQQGETRPLAGLPGADRTLLARAPLELAIAEIRFGGTSGELPPDAGLRLQARLQEAGLAMTRLEPRQNQRVNFAPGAPPSVEIESVGWFVASSDGAAQATVLPGSAVFQTARYHRWSVTMRPAIEALLEAVAAMSSPAVVVRVGLRYVNRFVDERALNPAVWRGRISDTFLGPIGHPELGRLVKTSQQQLELAFSETQGAIVRHGPFVDETRARSVSYLLDIDCFDGTPSRFDVGEVAERAEVLNRTAATVFQAVLTEEYRRELQSDRQDGFVIEEVRPE